MKAATASLIAYVAHAGQLDKSGEPYIGHPDRVADYLRRAGANDEIIAVGYLHDVIEDTNVTMDDLAYLGLSLRQENALNRVTKRDDETYFEYIDRLSLNRDAVAIKRADLKDNMDPNRGDFKGSESLMKRYEKTLDILDKEPG